MNRVASLVLLTMAALLLNACSMFGSSKGSAMHPSGAGKTVSTQKPGPAVASGSQLRGAQQSSAVTGVPGAAAPALPEGQRNADYRLGPLDLVEIKVFQLPDLDRAARVDQNGLITMPLIGPVQATGKTQSELETEIERLYGEKYLQDPRVTVFVKEYGSQRVTVAGAVQGPGLFVLAGPTTLLEAVALAKGLSDVASSSDIALIRFVDGQRTGQFYDLDDIVKGKTPDPVLVGGDIVYVQTSGIRVTMKELMQTSPILSVIRGF